MRSRSAHANPLRGGDGQRYFAKIVEQATKRRPAQVGRGDVKSGANGSGEDDKKNDDEASEGCCGKSLWLGTSTSLHSTVWTSEMRDTLQPEPIASIELFSQWTGTLTPNREYDSATPGLSQTPSHLPCSPKKGAWLTAYKTLCDTVGARKSRSVDTVL